MRAVVALSAALLCGCSGAVQPDFGLTATGSCTDHNVWANSTSPWVLTNPKVHIVFWGNYWITNTVGIHQFGQMTTAWNDLANSILFYQPLAEYGVGNGSLAGVFNSNWSVTVGAISDANLQQELQTEINDQVLPTNDSNSVYVVMLPPKTQAQYNIDNKFSGYHHNNGNLVYAFVEYDANYINMDVVASHEIYEAATDPDGGGYHGGLGETEVGDYCQDNHYTLDGYTIQSVWSEQQCKCVPQ